MKKNLSIITILLVVLSACSKKSSNSGTDTTVTPVVTVPDVAVPVITTNIFGALVNDADGISYTNAQKTSVSHDSLKCKYVRMQFALANFTNPSALYDGYVAAGLTVVPNVNNDQAGVLKPFVTDLVTYKAQLNNLFTYYKPAMVVIENEESNENYHSGPITDYFGELGAAIEVCHAKGIKVSNGGIVERIMTLLTWNDYNSRGLTAEAKSYASRAFPTSKLDNSGNPVLTGTYGPMLTKGLQMVDAYKNLNLDYVSFHWYEPVAQREVQLPNLSTIPNIDPKTLEETILYLRRATGKTVITNEIGQLNQMPGITTDIMTKVKAMNLPYVVWYSGDGNTGQAVALQNGNRTLRASGKAFANYIKTNYP